MTIPRPRAIVIGASAGGFQTLRTLFPVFPEGFPIPILVVQHQPAQGSGPRGCALLALHCRLPVREAMDKEPIQSGHIVFAPPGYHLLVEPDFTLALSTDPAVHHSRPAIDVLFETASDVYQAGLIGVLLTGASRDGTAGLLKIRLRGGQTLVQDPRDAEAPFMPRCAIAHGAADQVLPLNAIALTLKQLGNVQHE